MVMVDTIADVEDEEEDGELTGVSLSDVAALLEVADDATSSLGDEPSVIDVGVRETVTIPLGPQCSQAAESDAADVGDGGSRVKRLRVRLDRSKGGRLGIDVEMGQQARGWDGKSVLVKGIQATGLIPAWNVEFPKEAVQAGDRIVEANGCRGDTILLIEECKKNIVLSLLVEREVFAAPTAPSRLEAMDEAAVVAAAAWPLSANEEQVRTLKQDVANAKSATAVVQVARRAMHRQWAAQWAAAALHSIWRRSTLRTRREWLHDATVLQLADGLKREVAAAAAGGGAASQFGTQDDIEALLIALEALRRLGLQEPQEQGPAILRIAARLSSKRWSESTAAGLARLLWLAAPMRLQTVLPVLRELRVGRYKELTGIDIVTLVSGMHEWATTNVLSMMRRLRRGFALSLPQGRGVPASSEFRLSFDLTLYSEAALSDDPTGILRLECSDERLFGRMPSFCLVPGTTRLFCALGPSKSYTSKYYSPETGLPIGKPVRVTARVGPSSYAIFIDGKEASSQPAPQPMQKGKSEADAAPGCALTFWASDDTYAAAGASIGNITYRPLCNCEGRDEALLQKAAVRLQTESIFRGLLISELVTLAEGLDALEVRDNDAIRVLGQEILSRKGELTPEEAQRVHLSFQQCRQPLNQVWEKVGTKRKHQGNSIKTKQAFAVQPGHEEHLMGGIGGVDDEGRRHFEHEVSRVSPPRYVADQYRTTY